MKKKTLRFFAVTVMEGLAFLTAVFFIAWLLLLWRLSQGPLNVDFLTNPIEKTLAGIHSDLGLVIDLGTTELVWNGYKTPFELHLKDVHVSRADGTPVLVVSKIGMEISRQYLFMGKFIPKAVTFYGLALRVVRQEDGQLSFNLVKEKEGGEPESQLPSDDMLGQFLMMLDMSEKNTSSALGALRRVNIMDSDLLFEDRKGGGQIKAKDVSLIVTRGKTGIVVSSFASLPLGDKQAEIQIDLYRNPGTRNTHAVLLFKGVNPRLLAEALPAFGMIKGIDLFASGSVEARLGPAMEVMDGKLFLRSRQKEMAFAPFLEKPVPLEELELALSFDGSSRTLVLDDMAINLGQGAHAVGKGRAVFGVDDSVHLEVSANLKNFAVDRIKTYWPPTLTPAPRSWVTEHLSGGTASLATLDLALERSPDGRLTVEKLGGEIDFDGIRVDYFPPLEPVLGVGGKATYGKERFALALTGGKLADMRVSSSNIVMTELGKATNGQIAIDVSLSGPLKTALTVLDSKPLGYPTELGLSPDKTAGHAKVYVHFEFPLHQALTLPEVKVSANATLEDTKFSGLIEGHDLSGGPLSLTVSNDAFHVKGKALLGKADMDFDWQKSFSTTAAFSSRIAAKLNADPALLARLGADVSKIGIAQPMAVDLVYTLMHDGVGSALVSADLTQAAVDVSQIGYQKAAGIPATLSMTVGVEKGKPRRISSFKVESVGLYATGFMELDADGQIQKAVLDPLRVGEITNVRADIERRGENGYFAIIKGAHVDASAFFKDRKDRPAKVFPTEPSLPVTVSLEADKMTTGADRQIGKVKFFMRYDAWQHIDQMEMDGVSGGKPLYLRYVPGPAGHTLKFEAGNAGAALRALGISDGVKGGRLAVTGKPPPKGGGVRDLKGVVSMTDFTLVKAPALAKLLNALSLPGLGELLSNKGIAFKKMRADFSWLDRTPPESQKEPRQLLSIDDGQTAGASLGLTFEGSFDDITGKLDLKGTIIPVSDLNKLIGNIPLVGDILTGGTGALIAATYTVKGPAHEPDVTVNPLAALAPGLLRKLFFE